MQFNIIKKLCHAFLSQQDFAENYIATLLFLSPELFCIPLKPKNSNLNWTRWAKYEIFSLVCSLFSSLSRSSTSSLRASAFLLCMLSPVLHKMVCGGFKESAAKRLEIDEVDQRDFEEVLNLWCCKGAVQAMELEAVARLASVAERFQIAEVGSALEEGLLRELKVDTCVDIFTMACCGAGLSRVEASARKFALEHFEDVAGTEGFMRMGEEALGSLLESDELLAESEERVLEWVVRWMQGGEGELRGRGLLSKIRFPLMEGDFLGSRVMEVFPQDHAEWIEGLVRETLRLKAGGMSGVEAEGGLLGPKAAVSRALTEVWWDQYSQR